MPFAAPCCRVVAAALVMGALAVSLLATSVAASGAGLAPGDVEPLLVEGWNTYRARYIQGDGRVIDWFDQQISTSEGQAYALLRAVWMNDRPLFDLVHRWTVNNLQVKANRLLAWKWGRRPDGSWGVLETESATDADQDVALALTLAWRRWRDPRYREAAKEVLADIWAHAIVPVGGLRVLVAGDWVAREPRLVVHPSYLAPYAYRLFSEVDRDRPWADLVDASYALLERCTAPSRVRLPPDRCFLDRESGRVLAPPRGQEVLGDFSYDAYRVLWRLALDVAWFGEARALAYLRGAAYLRQYWAVKRRLPSALTVEGIPRREEEAPSLYGIALPYFVLVDSGAAAQIVAEKITPVFKGGLWGASTDYYSQNWVWFGLGLAAQLLPRFDTPR